RPTPSSRASARPSSIWKPGGSARLANGSALAWAHSVMTPRVSIASRVRAPAGDRETSAASASRPARQGVLAVIRRLRPSGLIAQAANVGHDRAKLLVVETLAEGRHARRLAVLDLIDDEFVWLVCPGKLWATALDAAAALVAPAAGRGEQPL